MKRICLIGNSHIGALKHGAGVIGPVEGVTWEFYGCPNGFFGEFDVVGGIVTPRMESVKQSWRQTSNGHETVELDRFDTIAVAGFAGMDAVYRLTSQCVTHDVRDADRRQLVSVGLWLELLGHALRSEAGPRLAMTIARETAKPVFLLPRPRQARSAMENSARLARWHESGDAERLSRLYETACRKIAPTIQVLAQPGETIADHLFTADEFNVGGLGLGMGKALAEIDVSHMNPLYGATFLRKFLAVLGVEITLDLRSAATDYAARRTLERVERMKASGASTEARKLARARKKTALRASSGVTTEAGFQAFRRERLAKIKREHKQREQTLAERQASRDQRAREVEHRRALRDERQAARAAREAVDDQRRRSSNATDGE